MSGANLLLVNPGSKRKRNPRKRRTAAQRRATKKMIAANKRRGGKRKRRNPSPPGASRKRVRRRSNPRTRAFTARNITDLAQAAAWGAGGAILLDVVLGYLPLPPMLKAGIPGKLTKAAGAIGLGVLMRQTGLAKGTAPRDMTVGALTVQFTGIGRELLAQFAPGVALSAYINEGGMGYAGSGWDPSNALTWGNGMSAYDVGEGYDIAAPGHGQPGLEAYESGSGFEW